MAANPVNFGSGFLIWIVALFSAIRALSKAVVFAMVGELAATLVWFMAALAIFALAGLAESVKAFREA